MGAVQDQIIARWSDVPLSDENINDPIASIAIWSGKTNFGRSRNDWWWSESGIHPNCYSDDTEVLTDHGWKLFKNVESLDRIMSIDPETRNVDFVSHKGLIEYNYDGDMVHFTGRNYDSLVTPDHNCLYAKKSDNFKSLRQSTAKDLIGKEIAIPRAIGVWENSNDDILNTVSKACNLDPIAMVKLWGWFLSEGNVRAHNGKSEIKISQKYPMDVIDDIGNDNRFRISKEAVYIYDKKIVGLFASFDGIHAEQKYIPNFLRDSSLIYQKIFVNSFMLGDGTIRTRMASKKEYGESTENIVRTSSPLMMADLTEMIIKSGKFCSITKQDGKGISVKHKNGVYVGNTDCYIINITKSKYRHYHKNRKLSPVTGTYSREIESVSYSGMVYDVELVKWHFLLVKRNGKLAWSGNCRGSWDRYYEELGDIEL